MLLLWLSICDFSVHYNGVYAMYKMQALKSILFVPIEKDMRRCPVGWPLPRPEALHHMVEDFLTEWDQPISHSQPLRRFLEHCLQTDLRPFYAGQHI